MVRKYISLDVETSGSVPGLYNMMSVGAVVVGDLERQFYSELKPLNYNYDLEAMKIGSLGLKCIDMSLPEFNPSNSLFNPRMVLQRLKEYGESPEEGITRLRNWIKSEASGCEPVLLTDVQPFDGNFIMWYFSKFLPDLSNPFGYKGVNIDVLYRGITRNMESNLRDLGIIDDRKTPHNSLDDALFQGKLAEKVLSMMENV